MRYGRKLITPIGILAIYYMRMIIQIAGKERVKAPVNIITNNSICGIMTVQWVNIELLQNNLVTVMVIVRAREALRLTI